MDAKYQARVAMDRDGDSSCAIIMQFMAEGCGAARRLLLQAALHGIAIKL